MGSFLAELAKSFWRFVRPTELSEEDTNLDVEKHYPNFATNRVWHETTIPYKKVIQQFKDWLTSHKAWENESGGRLKGALVTCGNWDIKTKIAEQYDVAGMDLPFYLMQWINLKDIYLNFYNRKVNRGYVGPVAGSYIWTYREHEADMATGMVPLMTPLSMQRVGAHHLGIDARGI